MKHLASTMVLVLFIAFNATTLSADDKKPVDRDGVAFFEQHIRPALVKHCYECHSAKADDVGGGLLLDDRQKMMKGGLTGPSVVPKQPGKSLLLQALKYDGVEMPPDQPLPDSLIAKFEEWIKRGAPGPHPKSEKKATAEPAKTFNINDEAYWSFRPVTNPARPIVKQTNWPTSSIDFFVLSKIESANLAPTNDATARTLVRRLFYDLNGLPPTFTEVEQFVANYQQSKHTAVEQLVDNLLARPQFGERWGRHWLDAARFGESNGDDGLGRNASFPHAWRYRDYVIDAVNRDVPYDRFLSEQIAGDLLPADSAEERNRLQVATGFLAIGAKPAAAMNKDFRMDIVDDQINVVSTAITGLSVACARCHDHKHDPIPTRDYYALAGIFRSTETLYGLAGNEKLTAPPTDLIQLRSAVVDENKIAKIRNTVPRFPDAYTSHLNGLQPALHARLDAKADQLTTTEGITFTAETYASLKKVSLDGQLPDNTDDYSVSFWFKNDQKNNAQPITAYLFSRGALTDKSLPGDHLGIGGKHDAKRTGKLFLFNGNRQKKSVAGSTVVRPGSWNHVVLIRKKNRVTLFLNGGTTPEIDAELPATFGASVEFRFGSRSGDRFAPLVGNLADLALFSKAISRSDALRIHDLTGRPVDAQVLGLAMGVRERAKPEDSKIHINGTGSKLGAVVPRGGLGVYREVPSQSTTPIVLDRANIGDQESGRLQLANWLTDPRHPQTSRVMVNRVWLNLFGRGIVSTPNDFGVYGARPSHPELLDYLAQQFVADNWSVKRLIRSIVLSRTYQLDSSCDSAAFHADPDNQFFARHSRRRLDAESLRDSMLMASGQLTLAPGSGSVVDDKDILINWPAGKATKLHQPSSHRSVYLCYLRHSPPPELAAFDLPDGMAPKSQRDESILPTQTLYLLNNPFVIEQSRQLAASLLKQPTQDDRQRIEDLFRRSLQRQPADEERTDALRLLKSMRSHKESPVDLQENWAVLCQSVLVTNEFRYVD